jgi:hypothetical protein
MWGNLVASITLAMNVAMVQRNTIGTLSKKIVTTWAQFIFPMTNGGKKEDETQFWAFQTTRNISYNWVHD